MLLMGMPAAVAHLDTNCFWDVPCVSRQWMKGTHCAGPVDALIAQFCTRGVVGRGLGAGAFLT